MHKSIDNPITTTYYLYEYILILKTYKLTIRYVSNTYVRQVKTKLKHLIFVWFYNHISN